MYNSNIKKRITVFVLRNRYSIERKDQSISEKSIIIMIYFIVFNFLNAHSWQNAIIRFQSLKKLKIRIVNSLFFAAALVAIFFRNIIFIQPKHSFRKRKNHKKSFFSVQYKLMQIKINIKIHKNNWCIWAFVREFF